MVTKELGVLCPINQYGYISTLISLLAGSITTPPPPQKKKQTLVLSKQPYWPLKNVIIRDICKAPTLRLKVLNKYNTHDAHWDENLSAI